MQGLSITFDFWSNRHMQSFLCITGQWHTDNIDRVSKIIDFSVFSSRHTGIDIGRVVKDKLVALDIYEKIVCITCDGAPNMLVACSYLNDEIPRIWCAAHRLHLVVINGLGFWLTADNIKDYQNNLLETSAAATTTVLAAAATSAAAETTTAAVTAATSATTMTTGPSFGNIFYGDEGVNIDSNEEYFEGIYSNKVFAYADGAVNITILDDSQYVLWREFFAILVSNLLCRVFFRFVGGE